MEGEEGIDVMRVERGRGGRGSVLCSAALRVCKLRRHFNAVRSLIGDYRRRLRRSLVASRLLLTLLGCRSGTEYNEHSLPTSRDPTRQLVPPPTAPLPSHRQHSHDRRQTHPHQRALQSSSARSRPRSRRRCNRAHCRSNPCRRTLGVSFVAETYYDRLLTPQ